MGNRTAGKGRERKEDRGKGKSMAKEQEWERKQGGRADRAERGACVFEEFLLRTAQTKGCSG